MRSRTSCSSLDHDLGIDRRLPSRSSNHGRDIAELEVI